MIPLIDIYLKEAIQEKINWIKEQQKLDTNIIPSIFGTLGQKITLPRFTDFVLNRDIKIRLGFPREPQELPCYVIMIAGEQEVPIGLGDNADDYQQDYDETDVFTQYVVEGSYMDSTYRIECWSDNGDLTGYMYILLKWVLLALRFEMLEKGFVTPKLSGQDLEPVPDYMPVFVYRRAIAINFKYENMYFNTEDKRGVPEKQIPISVKSADQIIFKPHYNVKIQK